VRRNQVKYPDYFPDWFVWFSGPKSNLISNACPGNLAVPLANITRVSSATVRYRLGNEKWLI